MSHETVPCRLDFPGGRSFAAGATRDGGGRWTMTCSAFPGYVATGLNIVKVRAELIRHLSPRVAELEARAPKIPRRGEEVSRHAPSRRRVSARARAEAAFSELRLNMGSDR